MPTHIALLRAINVTGHGVIKMDELRALCTKAGLGDVRTYIQSGNIVFTSRAGAATVKKTIEGLLERRLGKRFLAMIRSQSELEAVEKANPYPKAEPNRLMVVFLDKAPPKDALKGWKIPGDEKLSLIGRELYIHFPSGQGQSKLKIPFLDVGTGRNLNTIRALIALARTGILPA